ncbi:hypothetical protein [Pinirhizobacter sp.]|uniref:hypothetical protein n=1 Tax=Pinirhizobacter sp. TaxID=2950432 RepID=UPI002F424740
MTIPHRLTIWLGLVVVLGVVAATYWPATSGGFLFDDFPNIVDNASVQPDNVTVPNLVRAALSSPASEFRRPLASLSFAANYLIAGMNPYGFKVTNIFVHLLNGVLLFALITRILRFIHQSQSETQRRWIALLVAFAWMALPINVTAVVYVVQRMESLANVFVLLGLIGYVEGRSRSLTSQRGLLLSMGSVVLGTFLGSLAKETAVMLPLYALAIEMTVIRYGDPAMIRPVDRRILVFFMATLAIPAIAGLAILIPEVLDPAAWIRRDFTLATRLLSEGRIVSGYIFSTIFPTPHALSFYHDDYVISTSLFSPWTTIASYVFLAMLVAFAALFRSRYPLATLGIALYFGSNLLTGTILPLELVYEHRNYFSSIGILLVVVPPLIVRRGCGNNLLPMPVARRALLAALLSYWLFQTAIASIAWGDPLALARDLAWRAPGSPRAQYELGRTYIIYSHYDPASPFTPLAYSPLEKAAAIPGSSILAEQALIFFNAHMHRPIKDVWWQSMDRKLRARPAGVQDESSLDALSRCLVDKKCDFPASQLQTSFEAAMQQPGPSARLMAIYGDFAWNALANRSLAISLLERATVAIPSEPVYHVTLARMYAATSQWSKVREQQIRLEALNRGGSLDAEISSLRERIAHGSTDDDN